ncbi:hypothetical protein H310_06026 [Aphanomyces invadans]|uniref:PDZ domain-containing protein n=1 Tax=Aphanomyces invadans TaxID=157072 RepID=A0A024U7Y4_9STRA|nr:hypothetical protein H310_06026 [Aphanomyces invadans]ETW02541.1 hypothetical protein H310_06026 [Aphanomyces invadans]|eukprot:XP_008869146.1 hypothetical protein H310_06026 [Aphanomyces invadans]
MSGAEEYASSAHGTEKGRAVEASEGMDIQVFLAPMQTVIANTRNGGGLPSDLGNFSLEFQVDVAVDDDERLSDDLEYDDTEIERNTILIPDDLDDLGGDDLDDVLSSKGRQSAVSSDGCDSLNDSDSDIVGSDVEGANEATSGEFFDEARDSFDARAFESVMSDLNFEFGDSTSAVQQLAVTTEGEDSIVHSPTVNIPHSTHHANVVLSPDDEDIYDAEAVEAATLSSTSLRRLSIDHSTASLQQATGAMYKLIWEEGLLGLRLMMTPLFLPAVTKITGKSSMLGIHLVEVGDYLVKIGDTETHRMPFKDVINLLKQVTRPCPLSFRRASDAATPPMDVTTGGPGASKNFAWKSSIAKRIAARIEELAAEELAKESQVPAVDISKKYAVHWEDGPLGVSLVANKEVPYPQVTRITGKNRSAQVKDIVPGHYLVSIGNYDTASGTFNAAIKQLHDVIKPATLYFAPDLRQESIRPELDDHDEYDQDWEKKQPLGFTLKPMSYGTVVADVGLAKTAKVKQQRGGDPTSPTGNPLGGFGGGIKVGDALIWVNDECVENMPFYDALKTLRQAKRPLHLRFRCEHAAIKRKTSLNRQGAALPPPPPPPLAKDSVLPPSSPKRKDHVKKIDQSTPHVAPIPLSAKLHAALKDSLLPFSKKNQPTDNAADSDSNSRRKKKDRSGHSGDVRSSLVGVAPPVQPPPSNPPGEKPHPARSFWPSSSKDKSVPSSSPPQSSSMATSQAATRSTVAASQVQPNGSSSRHHHHQTSYHVEQPAPVSFPSPQKHAARTQSAEGHPSRHMPPQQSPPSSEGNSHTDLAPHRSHLHHSRHHDQHHVPSQPHEDSSKGTTSTTTKNLPFEYEITWRAGEELGVTLKPHPESRRAVVARVSGTNENAKRVALGDVLLGANGIPLPPQQKFKDTLSQLSTMPKPTVLRFLRPSRPVFPTSNRREHHGSSSTTPAAALPSPDRLHHSFYELEWPDMTRLGLLFAPHPVTNAPLVSRLDPLALDGSDHLKHVQVGDVLVQLGSLDLRGLKFDNCITALTVVTRPVVMRFRRGSASPSAGAYSSQVRPQP